jgi:hypothetical protein
MYKTSITPSKTLIATYKNTDLKSQTQTIIKSFLYCYKHYVKGGFKYGG